MEIETALSTQQVSSSQDEDLLTKAEVAKRLKKDTRTIDNWMRRGIIPYYKLGRTVAFRWTDVLRHFDAHFRHVG